MTFVNKFIFAAFFAVAAKVGQAQEAIEFSPAMTRCLAPVESLDAQIEICEAALETDETEAIAGVFLPPILAELRGETGDFEAAYEAASAASINGPELLLVMGGAQHKSKRFALASVFFEVAHYYFPEDVLVLQVRKQFLSQLRLELQDDDDAFLDVLSAGLRKNPSATIRLNERAMLYAAQGDIDKALADWDVAIEVAEFPQVYRFRRAEGLWAFKRDDEALSELTLLTTELFPGGSYETALLNRFSDRSLYSEADMQGALTGAEALRERVYALQVEIHMTQPDLDAALRIANDWVDSDIRQGQPLLERAKVLSAMGRDADALSDLNHAVDLALQHENGEVGRLSRRAILNRAVFYIQRDEFELAMGDIDRVGATDPPEVIEDLQRGLTDEGLFTGEIDGTYTRETKQALLTCIMRGMCDP